MMCKKKMIVTVVLLCLVSFQGLNAQNLADSARNTALRFFKTYDSIPYLTFDMRYTLYSDTVYSDFAYETMKGSCTMNGKKIKYSLGEVEYLQNDSFLIAVYHKDEQIVVCNPPARHSGSYLPLRETLDSLLQAYSANYDIYVKGGSPDPETDSMGYIRLVRKPGDSLATYNRYTIYFNIFKKVITSVEFEFTDPGTELTPEEEPDAGQRLLLQTDRRRTLKIEFLNYRFDNFSDSIYSENNLVWLEDGIYKPVDRYRNYQVINARN